MADDTEARVTEAWFLLRERGFSATDIARVQACWYSIRPFNVALLAHTIRALRDPDTFTKALAAKNSPEAVDLHMELSRAYPAA